MEHYRQLRIIRAQNKLKQQQVADVLGISRSTYCSYETGRRSPDLDTLANLARFYNLPIERFFEQSFVENISEADDYESEPDTRYLSQLSRDEIALVAKFRAMSKEDKKEVFDLADSKVKSKP